ncbi:TPA: hypothetical protein DIV48_03875 [Candidatus Kaiserbacteria bacterium]|nr:hypothetical protein [Candidatus Kaiserbacteria bacterium]
MHNELTNLLPPERERALARNYLLRIGVVAAVLVTVLTLSAGVLLIPTYVLLEASANSKKAQLTSVESTFSSADEAALSARLAVLSSNAAKLIALSNAPSISSIVREMLAIPRPGITLSGFSHVPPTDKDPATLVISGSSATRDALRNYQLALQEASFARSAVLPVSAYAKDANIPFTITVTLSP